MEAKTPSIEPELSSTSTRSKGVVQRGWLGGGAGGAGAAGGAGGRAGEGGGKLVQRTSTWSRAMSDVHETPRTPMK